ncbi:MAG: hypothetical protein V2A73_19170 [Pseudomonadota bacterium]
MSRQSLERLVEERLDEQDGKGARYVDLALAVRAMGSEELLLAVGGKWDRKSRRFVGRAERVVTIHVHPGQVPVLRWFSRWLRGYHSGRRDPDCDRVWAVLLAGGRRGGKTYCAVLCAAAFAVATSSSILWAVSPAQPETDELRQTLEVMLPSSWYAWNEEWQTYRLVNGSVLRLRSGYRPRSLKHGRIDIAFINEPQNQPERVYYLLRPATADSGGLVILAANPPEEAIGQWVEDFYDEAKAGKRPARVFDLDPTLNPIPASESLQDLEREVDKDTYDREIRGVFGIKHDRVWYAFSGSRVGHILEAGIDPRDRSTAIPDVTARFVKQRIGSVDAEVIVSADFQRSPHMVALIWRAFEDPTDPGGDPLLWVVDEVVLEQADENDLIDALEARGLDGKKTVVIADASGDWQDADRTKGRGSFDIFRQRGWRWIYPPDAHAKRNPDVLESIRIGNARLKTADGKMHVFIAPCCLALVRAMKRWRFKGGRPHKRSEHAHISDAFRYPLHRFYPRRRRASTRVDYQRIEQGQSQRRQEMSFL